VVGGICNSVLLVGSSTPQPKMYWQGGVKATNWYRTDDQSKPLVEWVSTRNATSRIVFTDVEPGKSYYIRAEQLGPRGQSVLSPVAMVIA